MTPPLIKIAIVDDHKTFRQALKEAFTSYPFIQVAMEAESGESFIKNLSTSEQMPDVVLLDVKMQGMSLVEILNLIYMHYESLRVIVLTAFLDEVYVVQSLNFGINAFLSKNTEIPEIVRAITHASNNEVYFTNLLADACFKRYLNQYQKRKTNLLPQFSAEEIKIVDLIKQEKKIEEIADIMCLSKRSIEIKRDKIKEKANAKSTIGLLTYFLKRGLIEL